MTVRLRRSVVMNVVVFLSIEIAISITSESPAQDKPNIVVVWGDDIGWYNPSAYNRGIIFKDFPVPAA